MTILFSNRCPWKRYPPFCHPERSRGTCGSADPSWECFSLVALFFATALLFSGLAQAQGPPRGFWPQADSDSAHSNWQKAGTEITPETVAKDFKLLWKLKLGNGPTKSPSFSEPLLFPGLITGRGFKDMALWADANTLYSVDSELGELIWKKDFPSSSKPCGNIQIVTEAPQLIHFGTPKPATPKPAPTAPPPRPADEPLPRSERRVGAAAGGGYFGLRGVYVVTSDGYIHEQIMATGLDYAPPVKFLAPSNASSFALNMHDKVVYTLAGSGCHNVANAVWSIDIKTPDYPINSYKTQKISVAGPAIGKDGTAYVVTGSGQADPPVYANSVVALSAGSLKVKDWYTPTAGAKGRTLNVSPVLLTYKEKELIVAPGNNGGIVLLDSQSLGGSDHHTPLAESLVMSKPASRGAWEGLATFQDKQGVPWVMASIAGPVAKFPGSNGPAPHGSIIAFKVAEQGGKLSLVPIWISRDLVNPAPPAIVNGVVFALEGGGTHATLYALDATTGKQLYSSEDAIGTYARLAGMSVGDGHVFFTTHDNTLYSFGIPLEH
jgi:outer membrane protein assembly factor BamB